MEKTFMEKLDEWFQTERAAGRILDIRISTKTSKEHEEELGRSLSQEEKNERLEKTAKAVYETVTGKRKFVAMTDGQI